MLIITFHASSQRVEFQSPASHLHLRTDENQWLMEEQKFDEINEENQEDVNWIKNTDPFPECRGYVGAMRGPFASTRPSSDWKRTYPGSGVEQAK